VGQGTDEAEWVAALDGDGEAFGRIFDRHRDRVRRHGYRLAPTPSDVDDLVAITFLEAWRLRGRVRLVDGSILPWLLVTAANVARNQQRSARRYRALLGKLPVGEAAPDPATLIDDTGVAAQFDRLPLADRQVLALCVVEGFSEREAASALGVPPGTVKSRLARARRRLAGLITEPSPGRI
jgi:RNA polymerase sigma-70 factor (ECF subfamily)